MRPYRSAAYLAWIRTLPCIAPGCGHEGNDVAAHHEPKPGQSATGMKCGDDRALPLCSRHHTGSKDARHNMSRAAFWKHLDVELLIKELRGLYKAEQKYRRLTGALDG